MRERKRRSASVSKCFVSFTSGGIRIIAIVAYKRFVGIGDMKANTMEEFDNREDFEVTFYSGME